MPLHRQTLPVRRGNQTVNAYFGTVFAGGPVPQEFSVVFDTGSGHVVLPSVVCTSPACLSHRRYNRSLSSISVDIDVDGTVVAEGQPRDQVTVEFGTGEVTGEFAKETVCIGPELPAVGPGGVPENKGHCTEVNMVMAVAMSSEPFRSFAFDGIFGLGLDGLTLTHDFGFFSRLMKGGHAPEPRFAVFLSDEGDLEESEIALGGHNAARINEPLKWSPVAMPDLGYWQVSIKAVWVGDQRLDICAEEDSCRGVVDTGTSLLGVPTLDHPVVEAALSAAWPESMNDRANEGQADCRRLDLPPLRIELAGFTIRLDSADYMRKNPHSKAATDAASVSSNPAAAAAEWQCRPRLMPISLPAPLGPHLFILGEPVLRKYYTVFDRRGPEIGFAPVRRETGVDDDIPTMPAGKGGLLGTKTPAVRGAIASRIIEARKERTAKKAEEQKEQVIVT